MLSILIFMLDMKQNENFNMKNALNLEISQVIPDLVPWDCYNTGLKDHNLHSVKARLWRKYNLEA